MTGSFFFFQDFKDIILLSFDLHCFWSRINIFILLFLCNVLSSSDYIQIFFLPSLLNSLTLKRLTAGLFFLSSYLLSVSIFSAYFGNLDIISSIILFCTTLSLLWNFTYTYLTGLNISQRLVGLCFKCSKIFFLSFTLDTLCWFFQVYQPFLLKFLICC